MFVQNCSECGRLVAGDIKYHTADYKHVFCDAYCSFEWHVKLKGENDGEEK